MGSSPIKKNKKVKTKKHVKKVKAQNLTNSNILTELEEAKNIKSNTPLEMSLDEPEPHRNKKRRGSVTIKNKKQTKKENDSPRNKKSDQKINITIKKSNIPIQLNTSSDTGSKRAISVDSGNLSASSNEIGNHSENNKKSDDLSSVNSVVNAGLNSSVNSGLKSSVNSGLKSSVNSVVNAGLNSSVNSDLKSSVNSVVNAGLNSSVNSDLKSSENSGINAGLNSSIKSVISPKNSIVSNLTSEISNLKSEEVDKLVFSESKEVQKDNDGLRPVYSSIQSDKNRGKFTFSTNTISKRTKSVMKKFGIFTKDDLDSENEIPTNIASTKHIFTESTIDDEPLYVVSDEDGEAMIVNETELYGSRPITKYKGQWTCSECTGHASDDDSEQIDDSDESNDDDYISPLYEKTRSIEEDPVNSETPVPAKQKKSWIDHFFSLTVLYKQKKYALILKKLTELYSPEMIERNSYDNCFITPYNDEVSQKYKTDIRVNASFVKTDHRTFIAASYPKRTYHDVFNEMTKMACDLIVSLTNEGEEYFIPDLKNGIIEENEIYKIEKCGNVTRIKFLKWEDFAAPNIKEFLIFYNKYLEFITDKPVLVHCKAGVGRTGTFILFDILKRKEKVTEKILLEELCKLRSQRNYLVHNEEQFKWIIAQFDIQ